MSEFEIDIFLGSPSKTNNPTRKFTKNSTIVYGADLKNYPELEQCFYENFRSTSRYFVAYTSKYLSLPQTPFSHALGIQTPISTVASAHDIQSLSISQQDSKSHNLYKNTQNQNQSSENNHYLTINQEDLSSKMEKPRTMDDIEDDLLTARVSPAKIRWINAFNKIRKELNEKKSKTVGFMGVLNDAVITTDPFDDMGARNRASILGV